MKVMKLFAILMFFWALSLPLSASTDDEYYESIRTVDTLFMVIEEHSLAVKFTEDKMEFTHYFSAELNRSFIVNDERGEVCRTYEGNEVLSCSSCNANEVSESCP